MADSISIKTRSGLTFTADVAGPIDGPLVLLLHGYPESRHSWRAALPALADAGYRAVAPDQRGYSADARPDPKELSNYAFDKLVNEFHKTIRGYTVEQPAATPLPTADVPADTEGIDTPAPEDDSDIPF